MEDYTDRNETEVALLTLAHMFRNLKQLHFESFKSQQKTNYCMKIPQMTSIFPK